MSPSRSARLAAPLALILLVLGGCRKDAPDADKDPSAAPDQPGLGASHLGPRADDEWNGGAIDWQPFDEGLRRAKATNKPVCLVFHADWCPHCKNFSRVFEDPRVVARAKDFVMVLVNADQEMDVNKKYATDGTYIPRTIFLGPDGAMAPEIHAPRGKYVFFYDDQDPASLLGGMESAAKKFAAR